jgi:oxygen-independent coproporphyrinogen-3 oxidase
MIDDYLDVLLSEIDETFEVINAVGLTVNTVYIGGGTPTTLNSSQLERLLGKINEKLDVSSLLEFTLEAGRPDTITKEKLDVAKAMGVTRISVNPQTLNDDILREIGRKHTRDDFFEAYRIAKESGIRDINVDLIAGLPGDDFKSFSETLDGIIQLEPTNITVHTFCVKKASDVLRNNSSIYSLTGGDAAKSVSYSQLNTKFAGYKPYYMYRQKNTVGNLENVGYSLDGHDGYYNVFMMEEAQTIFAVGAGAVTKLVEYKKPGEGQSRIKRIFNPKYPYEYLRLSSEKEKSIKEEALEFFGINEESQK